MVGRFLPIEIRKLAAYDALQFGTAGGMVLVKIVDALVYSVSV
jgi:hypothetical protein